MRRLKHNSNKILLFILFLTSLLFTGCDMDALQNKPNVIFTPSSYTAMDDIFIPDPTFLYKVSSENYIFRPVVYTADDKYEFGTKVYIKPNYSNKVAHLDEVASKWQTRVNKESNSLIHVQKKEIVHIANTNAYELIYTTIGYDDDRDKENHFIERVYFIPASDNQVVAIRMVRNVIFDSQDTDFWQDWMQFLKSIRTGTPSLEIATVVGKAHNTRHYHVRNLNFDIPIGEEDTLNKWSIKLNADRKDIWQTDTGEIQVTYTIADGYDYSKQNKNKRIKDKAESWGNKGAEIMAAMSSKDNYKFEYHEIPFGKHDTIYGTSDIEDYTIKMTFDTSYKDGKSISITLDGDTKTMEANKEFILQWLTQFQVIE